MIGGWWGGATFQGLVPYFYAVAAAKQEIVNASVWDERAIELDRCIYNNMVDKGVVSPPPLVGQEQCRESALSEVKNVHFTVCQVSSFKTVP